MPVFIESARLQHPGSRFICGDLQQALPDVLRESADTGKTLVIFPFNIFGNLREPENVLVLLGKQRMPFIIFGYNNGKAATAYYRAAGFNTLKAAVTPTGIRFTDDYGLNTIAYSDAFTSQLCFRNSILM